MRWIRDDDDVMAITRDCDDILRASVWTSLLAAERVRGEDVMMREFNNDDRTLVEAVGAITGGPVWDRPSSA